MFREALKLLQSPRNFWNFDQESTLRPEKPMGISRQITNMCSWFRAILGLTEIRV